MQKIGLVVGATGIVGLNLANHLAQQEDWTVYGLSRKPLVAAGVRSVTANLLDYSSVPLLSPAQRAAHPLAHRRFG